MGQSDVLHNRQFLNQEVLRTITLGLAPFIPFSQKYAMSIKQNRENFEMMPDPDAPNITQGIPDSWGQRKRSYFEQPGQSPDEIIDNAPRTSSKEVAKRLDLLFSNLGKTPSANLFEQSVVGEMLSTLGEMEIGMILDELGTPIQKGIETSDMFKNPAGGLGFDRRMTDDLRTVLSKAMGGKDLSSVVAIEETESKTKKELQKGLKGKGKEEAITRFGKNVKEVYGNFNSLLSGLKIGESGLGGALDKAYADPLYTTTTYNKQLLARAIDLVKEKVGHEKYMYTVPLGDTGMAATVFLNTVIKNKSPQINFSINYANTGGHGRLIELMALGLGKINSLAGAGFLKDIAVMDELAMNEAVLTANRVGFIGQMQEVGLNTMLDAGADISLSKKKSRGVMGLGTKQMADSLHKQIKAVLTDPKTSNEFTEAFKQMIADANRASDSWKNSVDPPIDFQGAEGVWNTGDNWKKNGEGEDFSVSPFLFMRRAGVKSFEPKNKSKFL